LCGGLTGAEKALSTCRAEETPCANFKADQGKSPLDDVAFHEFLQTALNDFVTARMAQ